MKKSDRLITMKKIILTLCLMLIGIESKSVILHAFGAGDGTLAHPYEISTIEQLKAIGTDGPWDAAYILMNDLDLSGSDWVPLGTSGSHAFKGHFDGNGNNITGLSSSASFSAQGSVYFGLFYELVNASVTNLNLTNVAIDLSITDGNFYVGVLAGKVSAEEGMSFSLTNVTVSGSLAVTYHYTTIMMSERFLGGLAGQMSADSLAENPEESFVNACTVDADLSLVFDQKAGVPFDTAQLNLGGLAGYASDVIFSDNQVLQSSLSLSTNGDIQYFYDSTFTGGLVGTYVSTLDFASGDQAVFDGNLVQETTIHGLYRVGGVIGVYKGDNYNVLENNMIDRLTIWASSRTGGIVGEANTLTIGASVVKDLTLHGIETYTVNIGGVIGYGVGIRFDGLISVTDMTYRTDPLVIDDYVSRIGGLAGLLDTASTHGLIVLDQIDIKAFNNLAGAVADLGNSTFNHVIATNVVLQGSNLIGGLFGSVTTANLSDLSVNASITGKSGPLGGMIAYLYGPISLERSYALGHITSGGNVAGGLIGMTLVAWNDQEVTLTDVFSRVDIDFYDDGWVVVGGLIGRGSVNDSPSTNKITMTSAYYAGTITFVPDEDHPTYDGTRIGAFIGMDASVGRHVLTDVYYDSTLFIWENKTGLGEGKTTNELKTKAGYGNFDFTGLDNWFLSPSLNDGYAMFNPGLVRVDFMDPDGQWIEVVIMLPGSKVTKPTDPVKTDYIFDGWFDDQDQVFDFDASLTDSVTLTAKFSEKMPDTGQSGSFSALLAGLGLILLSMSRKKRLS